MVRITQETYDRLQAVKAESGIPIAQQVERAVLTSLFPEKIVEAEPQVKRPSMVEAGALSKVKVMTEPPIPVMQDHFHDWQNKGYAVICSICHVQRTLKR